jgi:hypothetical protein
MNEYCDNCGKLKPENRKRSSYCCADCRIEFKKMSAKEQEQILLKRIRKDVKWVKHYE